MLLMLKSLHFQMLFTTPAVPFAANAARRLPMSGFPLGIMSGKEMRIAVKKVWIER
jgi:hypothetical protein